MSKKLLDEAHRFIMLARKPTRGMSPGDAQRRERPGSTSRFVPRSARAVVVVGNPTDRVGRPAIVRQRDMTHAFAGEYATEGQYPYYGTPRSAPAERVSRVLFDRGTKALSKKIDRAAAKANDTEVAYYALVHQGLGNTSLAKKAKRKMDAAAKALNKLTTEWRNEHAANNMKISAAVDRMYDEQRARRKRRGRG